MLHPMVSSIPARTCLLCAIAPQTRTPSPGLWLPQLVLPKLPHLGPLSSTLPLKTDHQGPVLFFLFHIFSQVIKHNSLVLNTAWTLKSQKSSAATTTSKTVGYFHLIACDTSNSKIWEGKNKTYHFLSQTQWWWWWWWRQRRQHFATCQEHATPFKWMTTLSLHPF